ncbi:VOC family protein [Rhizobium alvei]|jgi:catechol 2,3-dioxygenase-like lactoylglutathione lyase family enzyme|uniref:VOC family protein n=1 Tax=Rhizobium alvei TaxID=1132659 RepID=A0ABT8YIY9_9HYPH|nr:VOC family protein [Rhizobium alvei]MDO6963627.1 VOC family protein [Rhizobium alvei]
MIDHTGLSISNPEAAIAFYDQALAPLGISLLATVPVEFTSGKVVVGYGRERPQFWLHEGERQTPPVHMAFTAASRAEVDAFYAAAIAAGGQDNGAPGLRPHYHPNYYGAFVRDPDGNNIEAVCHLPE